MKREGAAEPAPEVIIGQDPGKLMYKSGFWQVFKESESKVVVYHNSASLCETTNVPDAMDIINAFQNKRIRVTNHDSTIASAAIREDRTRIRNAVLKAQESQLALFRMCWDKNLIEPVKQVGAELKDILAIVDGKV